MICVSFSLPSRLVKSYPDFDMLIVQILSSPPTIICCVYISPTCSPFHFSFILREIESISATYQHLIIFGDFTAPNINLDRLTSISFQPSSLCDLIFKLNLTQLIHYPTHNKGNILDLLITNIDNHISNIQIEANSQFLFSDHFIITFDLSLSIYYHRKVSRYVFDFSKADYNALNDYLLDRDFSFCTTSNNIEDTWLHLKLIIMDTCSLFIPKVELKQFKPPKWFNSTTRHHLNYIHTL